jgi:hypothetical protein
MKGADKDFIVVEGATTGVTPSPTVPTRLGVFQCDEKLLRLRSQLDQQAVPLSNIRGSIS